MPTVIMPPPPQAPALAGVTDLNTLVQAIVERPKDVGEFLKEYKTVIAKYEELTKKYGTLKVIEALQAKTQEENEEAVKDRAFAAASIEDAKAEASSIVRDAQQRLNDHKQVLDNRQIDIDAAQSTLDERMTTFADDQKHADADLERRESNWKTRWQEVENREESLNTRIAEMDSFTAKMKA